ncbi:MAG: hypothetical protein HW408_884, partial [Actinobacteria bacterium]|nr:hypothetical protein [Actinomycetota bacterium]
MARKNFRFAGDEYSANVSANAPFKVSFSRFRIFTSLPMANGVF